MNTKLLTLHSYIKTGTLDTEDLEKIEEAAKVLRKGGLVAFPTETVYRHRALPDAVSRNVGPLPEGGRAECRCDPGLAPGICFSGCHYSTGYQEKASHKSALMQHSL